MTELDKIKTWVKKNMSRQELASAVGVSTGTVNNWMAGNAPIPEKKKLLITRLMQSVGGVASGAAECPAPIRAVAVGLTSSEFEKVKEAAAHEHEELDLFARNAVLKRVADVLKGRE